MELDGETLTDDAFLGGQLGILQPVSAYRAGVDAVLLAAAAPVVAGARQAVLDAGAGVGVVGLCIAARVHDARVTLVEAEPRLVEIAGENIRRNGLVERVRSVLADITVNASTLARLGLEPERFDHVLANPPFDTEGHSRAPRSPLKARAHAMPANGLESWCRFLARMTAPGGTATMIHRADALPDVLGGLAGRFGDIRVLPIYPRPDGPAIRIIAQGTKGSRAPVSILPGLILHDRGNAFSAAASAILRHGRGLSLTP